MLRRIKNLIVNNFPTASRKTYHIVNRFIYNGDKYYCPICEKSFSKFLPGPGRIKKNVKCPGCSSLERHRLLWLYLKNKLNIITSKTDLLSVAPEYSIQRKLKSLNNIDYTSVDLDSKLAMYKVDLTNIPFEDNKYDGIVCYHVLEHIEDDFKAMSELFRILKPGGWAILQSPVDTNREKTYEDFSITSPVERKNVFGQKDHVRIYGRDYSSRLVKAGFSVKEDPFVNTFSEDEVETFKLDRSELIYFCTKQMII
jgi:SAM-dependent methyltransferase